MGNIDDIIVGKSVVIEELKKLIYAVAKTPTTVLVQGETGTGKEVISRAIHELSERKGKLVSVIALPYPLNYWNQSYLVMRKAHLQVRKKQEQDALNKQTVVHYS